VDHVVILRGERELYSRAKELFAAEREFTRIARDVLTWCVLEVRDGLVERMRQRVAAGVRVRKVYNPGVLADPTMAAELAAIVDFDGPALDERNREKDAFRAVSVPGWRRPGWRQRPRPGRGRYRPA
jgi:hypothetical protein